MQSLLTPIEPLLDLIVVRNSHTGAERRSISRDAERGLLTRLRQGVWVDRTAFETLSPEQQHVVRMRAFAAVAPTDVVFSHWSAAVLHGLPVRRERLRAVHVTSDDDRHHLDVSVHRFGLSDADRTRFGSLVVTGVGRTVVDLAGGAPFEEGVMAADAALAAGVSRALIEAAAEGAGIRRASARIDDVIAFAHPGAESAAESRFRVTMLRLGMEVPELQHRIGLRLGRVAFLDALVRSARVGIEVDGDSKYLDPALAPNGTSAVLLAEKRREDEVRTHLNGLLRIGWTQAGSPSLLRPLLTRVGVRPAHPRPGLEDYAAEARAAAPRRPPDHPCWLA